MSGNENSTKIGPPSVSPSRRLRVLVVGAGVGGICIARGLLRDGHHVTIFERRPDVQAAGGAVTIWPNGAMVLNQLGVDMCGAGQELSTVRVLTSTGRPLATLDLTDIVRRMEAPVRMVPRRVLLERSLADFPLDRIRCGHRAVNVVSAGDATRLEFEDGSSVSGDLVIGADGLHSMVRRTLGAAAARPTGWCSWQGLITLPGISEKQVAQIIIGANGNLGLWPAGNADLQWWFDLPWSIDFVRPQRPIDVLRSHFSGWSELADRVLTALTDEALARCPFPHFRHPIPPLRNQAAVTLLGDAAHTMPPTLAQGTNQALLDTMVLRKALRGCGAGDVPNALRWYEKTRRHRVRAVSKAASLPVAHGEAVLRPAAMVSDRLMTWTLGTFLRSSSHPRIAADFGRNLKPVMVNASDRRR